MARSGDRFEMIDGSVYAVTKSAADAGGEYVEMEFTLPPKAVSPPPHIHAELSEEYEVIEGALDVMIDGEWQTLTPGQSAAIAPGTLHTFKNRTSGTVRVRNVHRPPARFEDYIQRIHDVLAARGITSARDPRVPIYLSMVMLQYPETLAPGRAPERIGIKAMAGLGRLLRFDAELGAPGRLA